MKVRLLLRRLALAGSGATFGFIALASIIAPSAGAARYAYTVGTADAYNEFHAVFTGFWLGLSALMITAARRPDDQRLGDLCSLAIGLQATARFFLNDRNTIKFNYERRRGADIGSAALVGVFNAFFPFSNR